MIDGLGCRGCHTPFVQTGEDAPYSGTEAVTPDPRSSWGVTLGKWALGSRIKVRNLVGLSIHSAFHWRSTQRATRMLLLSYELISCCAADTNWCLDLRRRASAHEGRVGAEWR